METIHTMIGPSRAWFQPKGAWLVVVLLACQTACFSAPAYKPDSATVVTPEDPNSMANGMPTSDTNDIAAATSVAATTLHTAPDAAPPTGTANLLANANAMATIDSNDFVSLTQAFGILYHNNPAAYFITLEQVQDSALRGAIQYALDDTLDYHSAALRDNGAAPDVEIAQFASYWRAASTASNPRLFAAWAVPLVVTQTPALDSQAAAHLPSIATLIPQVSDHDAVMQALLAAAPANTHGVDGAAFAKICMTLIPMYQTSLIKYYQVLTQVPDKLLRDVINFTITDAVANHPTILTQSDGGASVFSTQSWPYYGQVGFAGTSQLATFHDISLDAAGPLQGKPYPPMQ